MSATTTTRRRTSAVSHAAGPRTPPPAPSKRPTRYPLYAEHTTGPKAPPPGHLAETAVAPLGQPPAVVPAPEPEERLGITERIARTVASGDPTWLMSFGVLVGALVAVFVLGCILVLI